MWNDGIKCREKRRRSKHFGKWVTRLAIWRDELLDRHVTQKQSTWFLFLSAHKHLWFCRFLAQGFKLCYHMKYFQYSGRPILHGPGLIGLRHMIKMPTYLSELYRAFHSISSDIWLLISRFWYLPWISVNPHPQNLPQYFWRLSFQQLVATQQSSYLWRLFSTL